MLAFFFLGPLLVRGANNSGAQCAWSLLGLPRLHFYSKCTSFRNSYMIYCVRLMPSVINIMTKMWPSLKNYNLVSISIWMDITENYPNATLWESLSGRFIVERSLHSGHIQFLTFSSFGIFAVVFFTAIFHLRVLYVCWNQSTLKRTVLTPWLWFPALHNCKQTNGECAFFFCTSSSQEKDSLSECLQLLEVISVVQQSRGIGWLGFQALISDFCYSNVFFSWK